MNELLKHPWIRVLLIATTIAMCSWALRETSFITLPVVRALGEVLVPVAIGFCIAYVLTPIVDILHLRCKLPRTFAAGIPFLFFLGVVVIGTILIVPTVLRQSYSMAERLFKSEVYVDVNHNQVWEEGEPFADTNGNGRYDSKSMFDQALAWIHDHQRKLSQDPDTQKVTTWLAPAIDSIETSSKETLQKLPQRFSTWITDGVGGIDWAFELGLNLILIPIYAFFLILAMASIRRGISDNLPLWERDKVIRIIVDIEKVVAAFFRGRLTVCLMCSIITWIGFTAISLFGAPVPYAALFALLIGLATAVPFAGVLFIIPAVLLNLLEGGGSGTAIAMFAVYALVQGLEGFVLTPIIMGREAELHPITLIVTMLLCGKLIGILGVILAVPIAASARILAREFLWPRLRYWAGKKPGDTVRVNATR